MTARFADWFRFSVGVCFPAIRKLCAALPVFLTAKVTLPTVAVFFESLIALSVIVTLTVVAFGADCRREQEQRQSQDDRAGDDTSDETHENPFSSVER